LLLVVVAEAEEVPNHQTEQQIVVVGLADVEVMDQAVLAVVAVLAVFYMVHIL